MTGYGWMWLEVSSNNHHNFLFTSIDSNEVILKPWNEIVFDCDCGLWKTGVTGMLGICKKFLVFFSRKHG